jgi:hypothetical protein
MPYFLYRATDQHGATPFILRVPLVRTAGASTVDAAYVGSFASCELALEVLQTEKAWPYVSPVTSAAS